MESKEKTEKTIEMRTEQLEAQVNFLIDKQEKIGNVICALWKILHQIGIIVV